MKEMRYVITDAQGIHARPAGMFVKVASAYPCKITMQKGERKADAKGILGIMSLGVKQGEEIVITADGEQEDAAIEAIGTFLRENM